MMQKLPALLELIEAERISKQVIKKMANNSLWV